jgi:hypothetical protein
VTGGSAATVGLDHVERTEECVMDKSKLLLVMPFALALSPLVVMVASAGAAHAGPVAQAPEVGQVEATACHNEFTGLVNVGCTPISGL